MKTDDSGGAGPAPANGPSGGGRPRNTANVTIQHIARRAGVSTATVSRTLANPAVVSAKTRARVLRAIDETGYTPNTAARNLRARRSMMILVIVPNVSNPFFAEVLRGVDDELVTAGYDMIIGNLDNLIEREARYVKLAQSGQVDGVLITTGRVPAGPNRTMADLGLAMGAMCAPVPGLDAPQVYVDDHKASCEVAGHFLQLGHRRFGYLSGPQGNVNETERYKGFLAGLDAAGIAADAVTYWPGDFNMVSGVTGARSFLADPNPPTAVFAACDESAIGFIKTVTAAGIDVPGDVSIIGFDGIPYAAYTHPTLTTMRQPQYELGRIGARALLQEIRGTRTGDNAILLPAPMILGASTAPPRAAATATTATKTTNVT